MGESSNKYLVNKPRGGGEKRNSMKDDILRSLRARTKERVAAIRDTESRMTPAQRDAVNNYEDRVSRLKTERVGIIGADGQIKIQSTKGTGTRTRLQVPVGTKYPDAILTHNHPSQFGDNLADRVNNTLSPNDMKAGITLNVKGIRVRSQGGYIYLVERPGDSWGVSPEQFSREHNALIKKYVQENFDKTDRNTRSALAKAQSPSEHNEIVRNINARANVAGQHRAMKELAKKYGFRYTRRRA